MAPPPQQPLPPSEPPGRSQRARLIAALAAIGLAFLGLAARLFQIQVLQHEAQYEAASDMRRSTERVAAYRGDIVLGDGVIVARDTIGYDLGIDPRFIGRDNLAETIRVVCEALDLPADYRRRRLFRALAVDGEDGQGMSYVHLGSRVSEAALAQIQEALARVLSPREKRALVVRREAWRTYPRGAFLGAVVGVTDAAPAGVEGIEKSMDLFLSPRDGQREFLVDASRRNQIFTLGNQYLAPVESYDVRLTIDSRVQAIVEEELSRGLEHEKADAGLLIVMDPRSGDVLAMASQPTYDPGRFAEYPQEELARRRKNAAVEKLYEPGSIIKPFIAACALERGLCRRDQLVRELASPVVSWDGGKVARFGQRVVRDVHEHSGMTVEDAVVHSSNIGMSILGLKLGREGLIDVLERFAFCRETGIELPAEAKGKYTQPEKWRPLTTSVSVSFGYEVMVSPIQLCRAFAALVNGGTLLRPRLVDRVFRGEEAHAGEPRQEVGRAITAETSKQMREVLRGVVERGTARWLRLEGFPFGGKTGTAVMQHGGAYRRGDYVASFEAFAPYDEPQVVILCMLEKPRGGSYYGSMVAGPIVVEVIRRLFHVAAKPEVPRI